MAHPYQNVREDKVAKSRVKQIAGRAGGGGVHSDAAMDRKLIGKVLKERHVEMEGSEPKSRGDRPKRANGGKVGKSTTVNVIVQPSEKPPMPPMPPMMPPGPPPMPPPRPPMPPPGPPMAGPPGGPPPGLGPMPPGGPIRSQGGRTYASGGAVKGADTSGPGWRSSKRLKTPVQHADGKDDATGPYGKNINRGKPVTFACGGGVATGGPINAPAGKKGMGPSFSGGARGGIGRLQKAARAAAKRK